MAERVSIAVRLRCEDSIRCSAWHGGLSAACYPHSHLCTDFLVPETRQRVGGRTLSTTTTDGHRVDLGGAYVGPTQNRILRMAHTLEVKTEAINFDGRNVLDLLNQRNEYRGTMPQLSPLCVVDLNAAMRSTAQMSDRLDPAQPWTADDACNWTA